MPPPDFYPIEKSRLFGLKNKRTFAALLGLSIKELKALLPDSNYNVFEIASKGKKREIQEPRPKLKIIQSRLMALMALIDTPSWLHSGKKGFSYITNGKAHRLSKFLLNLDIEKFYKNCKREYIFRLFCHKFKMSEDISWIVTDLVSYKTFLPTGSPTSQIIAFWAYEPAFERINKLAEKEGLKMSDYVDDLTFSGEKPIKKDFPNLINFELKKYFHRLNDKTKFYSSHQHKIVTGVAISPSGEIRVPNKLRHKIISLMGPRSLERLSLKERNSLTGLINSGRQIEPDFFPQVYSKLRAFRKKKSSHKGRRRNHRSRCRVG